LYDAEAFEKTRGVFEPTNALHLGQSNPVPPKHMPLGLPNEPGGFANKPSGFGTNEQVFFGNKPPGFGTNEQGAPDLHDVSETLSRPLAVLVLDGVT